MPKLTADHQSLLAQLRIDPAVVERVLAAWGRPQPDAWEGGFVIAFRAPGFGPGGHFRFAYLHGLRQGNHWLALPDAVRLFRDEPRRVVDAAAYAVVHPAIEGPDSVAAPVAWQENPGEQSTED